MLASASLLLAAASTQATYPVRDVLAELQRVCFTDHRYAERPTGIGTTSDAVSFWATAAVNAEWTELSFETADLSPRDRAVMEMTAALNHSLFGSFAEGNRHSGTDNRMAGGQVFKKEVAGRQLYLSLFGADDGSRSVGECRIHDPLGDGIRRNPISAPEGLVSQLDVHFGFDGWGISPFNDKVRNFDPYTPYGLTLVTGFHEQVIVI